MDRRVQSANDEDDVGGEDDEEMVGVPLLLL
jgi:hypothetical protein